jgi:hypothetical protein
MEAAGTDQALTVDLLTLIRAVVDVYLLTGSLYRPFRVPAAGKRLEGRRAYLRDRGWNGGTCGRIAGSGYMFDDTTTFEVQS